MDEVDNEKLDDEYKIKVFYPNDESLKKLGELLQNETSRKIIETLAQEEMYLNMLSEKLDIRISLVIHHLDKIKDLGLVDITSKPISKRTKDHNFYKIRSDVFLGFTQTKEDNRLKKIFKEGIKFTGIAIVSLIALFITDYDIIFPQAEISFGSNSLLPPYVGFFTVLVLGLIIERIFSRKKREN